MMDTNRQSTTATRLTTTKLITAWLYLALVIAQAIHSLEEVLTGLWREVETITTRFQARFDAFPILRANSQGFLLMNVAIVVALVGLIPFVFQSRQWALKAVLWIAAIEIINGLLHLTEAAAGSYFPGLFGGIAVMLLGIGCLTTGLFEQRKGWA